MRPFDVYVHPDFGYQPYEAYHAKQHSAGTSSMLASFSPASKTAATAAILPLCIAVGDDFDVDGCTWCDGRRVEANWAEELLPS